MSSNIKLVYICGMGHNGSTSLDLLLDKAPGVVGTSQLNDLLVLYDPRTKTGADRSQREDFWETVLTELTDSQRATLAAENRSILKEKQLFRFVCSRKARRSYAKINEVLIDALAKVSGEFIFIDSSKNVSRCLGLLETKYDIRVIHLTRDVRGYVESHNKRRAENGLAPIYFKSTLIWFAKNAATSLFVRPKAKQFQSFRYEDMMLQPEVFLQRMSEFIDVPLDDCTDAIMGRAPLKPSESLGFEGNRVLHGRKDVFLDRDRIRTDGLFQSLGYWILLGWVSKFWKYRFKQNYF